MKKITILASALMLAGVFQANAQMGIGTPNPSDATMLEVQASDKGVLIPRVSLTATGEFAPLVGTSEESILVYNISTSSDLDEADAVWPGFYYWRDNEWQRIVNAEDLNAAIENLDTIFNENIEQIHDLINYIAPSNPNNIDDNGDPIVTEDHSTVVWDEGTGNFYLVTYDPTSESYVRTIINLENLISGAETHTFIRIEQTTDEPDVYHYFSEEAIKTWMAIDPANNTDPVQDMLSSEPGVVTIDVVGDVVNNFEYILEQEITYEGGTHTIEEIIQMISSEVEGNVIYTEINPGEWVFQYFDGTNYVTIDLTDLVAEAETNTFIRIVPETDGPDVYYYFSEEAIKTWLAADSTNTSPETNMPITEPGVVLIDPVADVLQDIINEGDVYVEILNMLEGEYGNVYFDAITNEFYYIDEDGDQQPIDWSEFDTVNTSFTLVNDQLVITDSSGDTVELDVEELANNSTFITTITSNQEFIDEIINMLEGEYGNVFFGDVSIEGDDYTDVLYYYDDNGDAQLIDVANTLIQNLIDNSTQVQELKNILGDTIVEGDVVYTGDTIEGLAVISYKGTTSIGTHTAETSGVDVDLPAGVTLEGVVGISLYQNGNLITTTVTDVEITGSKIDFNIGVGTFYQVLPQGDYEVIVYATIDE